MENNEEKVKKITQAVAEKFKTFGNGKFAPSNPRSYSLKNAPPQFADGVYIEQVVRFVLEEADKNNRLLTINNS